MKNKFVKILTLSALTSIMQVSLATDNGDFTRAICMKEIAKMMFNDEDPSFSKYGETKQGFVEQPERPLLEDHETQTELENGKE